MKVQIELTKGGNFTFRVGEGLVVLESQDQELTQLHLRELESLGGIFNHWAKGIRLREELDRLSGPGPDDDEPSAVCG